MTLAGVAKAFGAVEALDGVSLRAAAGEIVAVVGPERVREVDAARARLRAAGAGRRHASTRRRRR